MLNAEVDDPYLLHQRDKICATRKKYREGRRETAVKVYTVNQESKYLLVQGVPSLGIHEELIKLFALYGTIMEYRILDDFPTTDKFTDVYWIKFEAINAARIAKRKMDDFSFYGSVLHVCYCPEYETPQDTREKLQERRKAIAARVRKLKNEQGQTSDTSYKQQQTTSAKTVASSNEPDNKRVSRVPDTDSEKFSSVPYFTEAESSHVDYPQIPPTLPSPPIECYTHRGKIVEKSQWKSSGQYRRSASVEKFSPWSLVDSKNEMQAPLVKSRKHSQPVLKPCDVVVKTNNLHESTTAKPKFIPRQAVKRVAKSSSSTRPAKTVDPLNDEIRRNAFILGKRTGPQNKFDEGEPAARDVLVKIDPMEETRIKIREKLKQFTESEIERKRRKLSS